MSSQIIGGRDIVVSSPEYGLSVTYRKGGFAPMLFASDGIGRSSEPSRVKFCAQAWNAVHRKPCTVGWLRVRNLTVQMTFSRIGL